MACMQTKRRVLLLLSIKHANDLACAIDNRLASACSTCRRARWLAHPSASQDLRILPLQLLIARQLLMDLFQHLYFAARIASRNKLTLRWPPILAIAVILMPLFSCLCHCLCLCLCLCLHFFVVVHCP
ncbi:hypothetical protein BX070DRAFT_221925 [Coemansia spiralis]|nr:hypothetical protein BX070DRAFT_231332 [Coemansia spiralis]KAI9505337.1 hypothetical protein BX070DRAFT_221925 [Coemansia spiralis]